MDRLAKKFETAKKMVPPPIVEGKGHPAGLLAFGTTHWSIVECRDQLRTERGIDLDYLRLRAVPFTEDVRAFLAAHDHTYVVEQNRDGQMTALLRMHFPDLASRLRPVLHYNGLPIDARSVTEAIAAREAADAAPSKNGAR